MCSILYKAKYVIQPYGSFAEDGSAVEGGSGPLVGRKPFHDGGWMADGLLQTAFSKSGRREKQHWLRIYSYSFHDGLFNVNYSNEKNCFLNILEMISKTETHTN